MCKFQTNPNMPVLDWTNKKWITTGNLTGLHDCIIKISWNLARELHRLVQPFGKHGQFSEWDDISLYAHYHDIIIEKVDTDYGY